MILDEQIRSSKSIRRLYRSVSVLSLNSARVPEKVRQIVREEMQGCPAHQHYDGVRDALGRAEGEAQVQRERIATLQKEVDRIKRQGVKGKSIVLTAPDKKTLVSAAIAAVLAAVGVVLGWIKAKG